MRKDKQGWAKMGEDRGDESIYERSVLRTVRWSEKILMPGFRFDDSFSESAGALLTGHVTLEAVTWK